MAFPMAIYYKLSFEFHGLIRICVFGTSGAVIVSILITALGMMMIMITMMMMIII
jgi:hypothetical protein